MRDHATVNYGMTNDPDYRALPAPAQHLYLSLWVSAGMSYCGVRDWRPSRISGLTHGYGAADVRRAAQCLEARHFIVTDDDTEEVLLRSWVRFDGLMRQWRLAVSFVNAYTDTASSILRGVIVHEAIKLRQHEPELRCWQDERVVEMLAHPSISAKSLPPVSDPFGGDFAPSLDQTQGGVWGSVCTPSTPTPTPTPLTPAPSGVDEVDEAPAPPAPKQPKRKPAKALPADWEPTETHWERRHDAIDVQGEAAKFRLHAEANDRRQVNWNAAFSQWLMNARPSATVHPLRPAGEGPDDWMRRSR